MKLIAETAWHHEGDFNFFRELVDVITEKSTADIVKLHITLDLDEYMGRSHPLYDDLKAWIFSEEQWVEILNTIKDSSKGLMLLVNDRKAVDLAMAFAPELVEIHSVCLNDVHLMDAVQEQLEPETVLTLGVGGSLIEEIDHALHYMKHPNKLLMFGFQNYPTRYEDINLRKMRSLMRMYPKVRYGYADHTAWDAPNNEIVTLLGAAVGVEYVEKHVTTRYGEKRTDWPAAVSVEMFNSLKNGMDTLALMNGNGLLGLNEAERAYSSFGQMKKAAVLAQDVNEGDTLEIDKIVFQRCGETSDLSQVDIVASFGRTFVGHLPAGHVLMAKDFNY